MFLGFGAFGEGICCVYPISSRSSYHEAELEPSTGKQLDVSRLEMPTNSKMAVILIEGNEVHGFCSSEVAISTS